MNARDAVSASLAECYITIEGNRYNLCRRLTWKQIFEKEQERSTDFRKTGKGNKATGWTGSARRRSITIQSIFRNLMKRYKDTGEDVYFDIFR